MSAMRESVGVSGYVVCIDDELNGIYALESCNRYPIKAARALSPNKD